MKDLRRYISLDLATIFTMSQRALVNNNINIRLWLSENQILIQAVQFFFSNMDSFKKLQGKGELNI